MAFLLRDYSRCLDRGIFSAWIDNFIPNIEPNLYLDGLSLRNIRLSKQRGLINNTYSQVGGGVNMPNFGVVLCTWFMARICLIVKSKAVMPEMIYSKNSALLRVYFQSALSTHCCKLTACRISW